MSRNVRKWRRALAPLAIVVLAAGLAINTGDADAQSSGESVSRNGGSAGSGAAGQNPDTSAPGTGGGNNAAIKDTSGRASEGSGAKNVYSQETLAATPTGPNAGRELFVQGCASCHGVNGEGKTLDGGIVAPPLIGVGAAAVDFYVGTGRMPLDAPMKQAPRRDPVYTEEQVAELAKYVATLGEGPAIPNVEPEKGDLVEGNLLYSNNCAACHHSTGSGGAVGAEYYAPNLYAASPKEVAEAIRVGPGAMPLFGQGSLNDQQVNSLVRYVEHLKTADKPGGFSIGSLGPFSEGFIGWIVGLGALLGLTRWIGTRE